MTTQGEWPSAATRIVALLGWPARYSRSPAMHNAAFRHDGVDLVYVALPCQDGHDLATVVAALRAVDAAGANVTVPHKQQVLDHVDELTAEAAAVGAVNTLVFNDERIVGDNTDALGLADDWQRSLAANWHDRPVCVVGTGGAARAATVAASRAGAEVTVLGRRGEAAAALVAALLPGSSGPLRAMALSDPGVASVVANSRLIVNATPLGMGGESLPAPFMQLAPSHIAYDLVYEPPVTPFLAAAQERGVATFNGLGMLVAQAARAYTAWTGASAPVDVMAQAVGHSWSSPAP